MIDVEFEVDGRKIEDLSKVGDALEQAVLSQVAESVQEALEDVTCPEHDKQPQVTVIGKDLDSLEWQVSGCCEALIEQATSKLS